MEERFRYFSRGSTRYGVSREKHTCLKSQVRVSIPYMIANAIWNNAFVGSLNFRSRN